MRSSVQDILNLTNGDQYQQKGVVRRGGEAIDKFEMEPFIEIIVIANSMMAHFLGMNIPTWRTFKENIHNAEEIRQTHALFSPCLCALKPSNFSIAVTDAITL